MGLNHERAIKNSTIGAPYGHCSKKLYEDLKADRQGETPEHTALTGITREKLVSMVTEKKGKILTASPPSQSVVVSMLLLSISQNLTRNSSPAAKKRFLVVSN